MPRILLRTLLTLLLAPAAQATVSVELVNSTGNFYSLADPITLRVLVTANAGETDNAVFGAIVYDPTRLTPVSLSQNLLPGQTENGNQAWSLGQLRCYTTVRCIAFSQVALDGPAAVNVTNFEIAVLTFQPRPEGFPFPFAPLFFDWVSTPTTQQLDFFGVTRASGICLQGPPFDEQDSPSCPVPEPGTAGLLALGLAALAVAARGGLRLRSGSTPRSA